MICWAHWKAACALTALCLSPIAYAQSKPAMAKSTVGRTPEGLPDIQGVWTNSSVTVLERQNASLPLALTAEQVDAIESATAKSAAAGARPTDPNEGAPRSGGGVGGYNAFWLDRGARVGRVKGEARSSWIVDPPNGRLPVSESGKKRIGSILAKRGYTDPEALNPADRCLVGSRGSGGPPMLNNIYNNTYQIVQTPEHIMINVEMMHDARIIRIDQDHKPDALQQWLGDSVGHWEGDTLVVETRGWKTAHGEYEPVFISKDGVVTERFARLSENELLYQFEVHDPEFYSQTWHGEMTFSPASGDVFEYACHEANYAMVGILQGARLEDRKGSK